MGITFMCKGQSISSFTIQLTQHIDCPECGFKMEFTTKKVNKVGSTKLSGSLYCSNKECILYNQLYQASWPKVSLIRVGEL